MQSKVPTQIHFHNHKEKINIKPLSIYDPININTESFITLINF